MPGHYGNGNGNGNRTTPTTRTTSNDNPVIRLFNAPTTPRYYRPNGSIVPIGAELHEHQDGTIMTEHSMGPNDNSVVVTTVPPNGRATRTNGLSQTSGRRTRARRQNQATRTQRQNNLNRRTSTQRTETQRNQRTRTSTGGMGGGRTGGGSY